MLGSGSVFGPSELPECFWSFQAALKAGGLSAVTQGLPASGRLPAIQCRRLLTEALQDEVLHLLAMAPCLF